MKRIAILQSNYIPWKGYFDMIASVDEFILLDEVTYSKGSWRNRNMIKTPTGVQWLTVPVVQKGLMQRKISEVEIRGNAWAKAHWTALEHNYRRAPYFVEISKLIKPLYLQYEYRLLSELNRVFIKAICNFMNIETKITDCRQYELATGRINRILELCEQAGASEYVSGPAARAYLDEGDFALRDLKLSWFEYTGYIEYPQLWGDFFGQVSILDLLFNCGPNWARYMRPSQ